MPQLRVSAQPVLAGRGNGEVLNGLSCRTATAVWFIQRDLTLSLGLPTNLQRRSGVKYWKVLPEELP
jgi:hypothetical protein